MPGGTLYPDNSLSGIVTTDTLVTSESERNDMTQPVDPWAAAGVATAPATTAAAPVAQQQATPAASGGSQLGESYPAKASQLFSGGGEVFHPSLFNKTHAPGTTFSGIIIAPPRDVQSTSFPTPSDPNRYPQYWCVNAQGKRAPGTDAVDPRTGQPNDKVMDLVIELQTDIRLSSAELLAINPNRDPNYVDEGKRVWQVSGSKRPKGHVAGQPTNAMRALLDAIEAAAKAGVRITDDESMVGLKLTVRRIERLQPGVSTSPWTFVAKLEKP